jgi:Kef-type K+ transport system membrane component KefB
VGRVHGDVRVATMPAYVYSRRMHQSEVTRALGRISELRDLLNVHPLFALGALLIIGYILGKLAGKARLPEITGFILAGILMGESVTGIIPHTMGEDLKLVTEIALGLIAITIGGEFYAVKLKKLGGAIVLITLIQIATSFVFVTLSLFFLQMPLPFALMIGAIASATAPAATVAIVQSLRARGKFVDYLYGVVALDDAGAVILFGVVFAVASGFVGTGIPDGGASSLVLGAFAEVGVSLVVGAISGVFVHLLARRKSNGNEVLIITLGVLLMTTAFAIVFHLSPLLTNMAAGAVIINLSPQNHRIFRFLEPFTPPIYALFFVIAGTELRPEVLAQPEILILGGVYILTRAAGKYSGVFLGCKLAGVEPEITNNLGICMFPQAGVAIGLVLLIQASPLMQSLTPANAAILATMTNVVLFSVFVNEIVGPPLSKGAIIRGNRMEV